MRERLLAALALATILAGAALWLAGEHDAASWVWGAGAAAVLVPLVVTTARSLAHGDVGVDAIALVAIAGALALGEQLTAAIVALMMSGGSALEAWAAGRARRELHLLVERAPRVAHRYEQGSVEEIAVEELGVGDVIVVRAGEVVPADGYVVGGVAVVDESALTGEALPATAADGEAVRSGTANAGNAFDLRVARPAADSAYAAIVRLVRAAESDRARFTRVADRYASYFLPFALALAGIAWLASDDPERALAVMVVATPCPLILAAPISFVAGLSRAARAGIIVKGADALERLGGARTVLLDKTGTLTHGLPDVEAIVQLGDLDDREVLRLAASVDQMSAHVLAESIVRAARERGLELTTPLDVQEEPGQGIVGTVDGHRVSVGSAAWHAAGGHPVAGDADHAAADAHRNGHATVMVGIDGITAAVVVMADPLRPGAESLAASLRETGVEHVALVTGDSQDVAEEIAARTGIETVYAEQSPEGKLDVVRAVRAQPGLRNVVMVGDGINDAPALALADVGIAIAGIGATISSETADAVVTVEQADRIALAVRIGRRSLAIARQSVVFGLGLSVAAMFVAAAGYLPPVWGALLQEGIDVAVIVNALRALNG
jgi:heavy metal translocating P-type ATPase